MITLLVGALWSGLCMAQAVSLPLEDTSAPAIGEVTAVGYADGTAAWVISRGGATSLKGTSDGGKTWTQVPLERGALAPLGPVPRDVVVFSSPKIGLIGAGDHGWSTSNAGKAWKPGPGPALAAALMPTGKGWLGVQSDPAHWQSRVTEDGGKTWVDCGPSGDGSLGVPALVTLASGGGWMLSRAPDGALRAWTSPDNGCNWLPQGQPSSGLYVAMSALDGQRAWLLDARGAMQASADGGKTWAPLAGPPAAQLYFATATDGWLLALDGRLHKTSDGGQSWAPLSRDAALAALADPRLKTWGFGQLLAMLLGAGGYYPS